MNMADRMHIIAASCRSRCSRLAARRNSARTVSRMNGATASCDFPALRADHGPFPTRKKAEICRARKSSSEFIVRGNSIVERRGLTILARAV
jgi:hypothetical protein